MSKVSNALIFVVGAVIGATATWYYVKRKYEQIAQEEIDSVKEVFSNRKESVQEDIPTNASIKNIDDLPEEKPVKKQSYTEYASKFKDEKYIDYTKVTEQKTEEVSIKKPYVIPPDVFGDNMEYDNISLYYYADAVLADSGDEIVENVEEIVGFDALNHFGEYEDDSVFVRNDLMKCDYEILLSHDKYIDIVNQHY